MRLIRYRTSRALLAKILRCVRCYERIRANGQNRQLLHFPGRPVTKSRRFEPLILRRKVAKRWREHGDRVVAMATQGFNRWVSL
jgi:hypothetical protein